MFRLNLGLEDASALEKILLGWWAWAFIILILNSTVSSIAPVLLFPIVFPLSFFLSATGVSTAVGYFMTFSWLALIVGGIEYSRRKRRIKKQTVSTK